MKVTFQHSLNSAVICTTVRLEVVSPAQTAMAWWQTTLFLQSKGLGRPGHTHMSTSSHVHSSDSSRNWISLVPLLYLFALVPLTLPAPQIWPLPFNHECLDICHFLSMWSTLATLSRFPPSNQAGPGSPGEHSYLYHPPIWNLPFQTKYYHFISVLP